MKKPKPIPNFPTTPQIIENFTYVLDHITAKKDPQTVKMKELTKDILYLLVTGEDRKTNQ